MAKAIPLVVIPVPLCSCLKGVLTMVVASPRLAAVDFLLLEGQ